AMTSGRLGVALVMDQAGALKGLFTDGDLRRSLMKDQADMNDIVDKHMTLQPLVIDADVKLIAAEELMRAH
ncbi:MAG: hypothetical protein VKK63_12240, partial [Synechococcus sp.]|nr:hypothetical protein [Synechococcus sp.]